MKAAKIALILIGMVALMCWVRGGAGFDIAKALPFCGGHEPGIYDIGAIAVILLLFWGLGRTKRARHQEDAPRRIAAPQHREDEYELEQEEERDEQERASSP